MKSEHQDLAIPIFSGIFLMERSMRWRSLIIFLLFGFCTATCQAQVQSHKGDSQLDAFLHSFQLNHTDESGRPNFMRIVFDKNYFYKEMSENEIERMEKLKSRIIETGEFLSPVKIDNDGIFHSAKMLEAPARLHPKIISELNSEFGEDFTKRTRRYCYHNFINERSLEELIALPFVANSVGLNDTALQEFEIRAKKVKREFAPQIRSLLEEGLQEILDLLSEKRKNLLLKRLGVTEKREKQLPDWLLSAVVKGSRPQRKFILARGYDVNKKEFEYAVFLRITLASRYLELVEEQDKEYQAARENWLENKKTMSRAERNKQLAEILLDEQFELLKDFAWRDVYFRGDVTHFFGNPFIQEQLEIREPKKDAFLKEVSAVSTRVFEKRRIVLKEFRSKLLSSLDGSVVEKINALLN